MRPAPPADGDGSRPWIPYAVIAAAVLAAYANAVREIARQRGAVFVDLPAALAKRTSGRRLTENGIHLTPDGLREVAAAITRSLGSEVNASASIEPVRAAIAERH